MKIQIVIYAHTESLLEKTPTYNNHAEELLISKTN